MLRAVALVLLLAASGLAGFPAAAPVDPVPPLAHVGRWLTDATGRVVMLHGVNDVAKSAPYYSAARGFGADDAAFLASEGFNALRLGVDMRGLMPLPGQLDDAYVEHLATTVADAAAAGIFVLLDFHQDGYTPRYNGNGFPDWMALDDGLPNPPDAVFPLYYVQNPAMQRAFEHFWGNAAITGGLGLQEYFTQALARITTRFAAEPMVIGTELMNEPWPGATWQPCIDPSGCFALEAERLLPFYQRGLAALRTIAPAQFVWVEPFVLFNFGRGPTSIPGTDPGFGLSFHSYALNEDGERNVARFGAEAAARDGAPVIVTEFGASTDPILLNRLTAQFEAQLLPWMFWSYDGQIVRDQQVPLTPDAVYSQEVLDALVRPYPVATAGIPTRITFDPVTKRFDFDYTTDRAGGGRFPRRLDTIVFVPRRHYPDGYTVRAPGARVLSALCAEELRLHARRPGRPVSIQITPGLRGRAARRGCPQ